VFRTRIFDRDQFELSCLNLVNPHSSERNRLACGRFGLSGLRSAPNAGRIDTMGFVRGLGFALCICVSTFGAAAYADEPSDGEATSITDALFGGEFSASFRYRYARIDQANFAKDADASTYQLLLGYETGTWNGFSGMVQLRQVGVIGEERYNSTINGLTQYPVEADPDAGEIDQLYLRYAGVPNLAVTVGRRKLNWGNQRFVSALGWRQNNRSFDGVVVEYGPVNDLAFRYAYASNVNRAFTDDSPVGNFDGDFHLVNGIYSGLSFGDLTGYAYLHDFDDAFALGLSSQSYGANFTGHTQVNDVRLGYTLEFANQSDYGSNPGSFDLNYYRVEPSLAAHGFTLRAGYEVLEGDGNRGFQTPFALLHAYNGWADQFLTTPANGLQDTYGSVSYRFGESAPDPIQGVNLTVAYHDFQSDRGSMDYGTEWDAVVNVPLGDHFSLSFKAADYDADTWNVDTQKFWIVFTARY
jgi:hypothetical protein